MIEELRLNHLKRVQIDQNMSYIFISHTENSLFVAKIDKNFEVLLDLDFFQIQYTHRHPISESFLFFDNKICLASKTRMGRLGGYEVQLIEFDGRDPSTKPTIKKSIWLEMLLITDRTCGEVSSPEKRPIIWKVNKGKAEGSTNPDIAHIDGYDSSLTLRVRLEYNSSELVLNSLQRKYWEMLKAPVFATRTSELAIFDLEQGKVITVRYDFFMANQLISVWNDSGISVVCKPIETFYDSVVGPYKFIVLC